VVSVARRSDEIIVAYTGGDEVVAALVARGVGAGLAITRVTPERDDLERIFLEVTHGDLQ
jgi:ABC-2 type transport system ATP-binding protein